MMRPIFGLPALVLATGIACAQDTAPWPAPTPDEIRATIQREMEVIYLSPMNREVYGFTGVTVALGEIKIGDLTYRNLSYEKALEPVWPVTTTVTVTVQRAHGAPQIDTRGEGETWYFFKTANGVWTYRLGR